MTDNNYVQINGKLLAAGIVAGIVASSWAVLPFFISGLSNLLVMTSILGVITLVAIVGFEKKVMIKSGALALGVFVLMSYLLIPFASGFFVGGSIDTSQYADGDYATVDLALPGLFCSGCAYSSQTALKGIPGVVDAEVSFDEKGGTVVYDPKQVSPEEIVSNDLIQAYGGEIVK